jgi:hypothetical protein
LLSGEPKIYVKTAESGNKRPQAFCPECGTHIYATAVGADPKVYAIRVGSIRQRDHIVPLTQKWSRSAQPWVTHVGSMQKFEKEPSLRHAAARGLAWRPAKNAGRTFPGRNQALILVPTLCGH